MHRFSEAHVQNAVDRHAQLFGGYQASRPNVIFVNGENDPWSALSVIDHRQIYITPGVSNSENCVILIKGKSTCVIIRKLCVLKIHLELFFRSFPLHRYDPGSHTPTTRQLCGSASSL